MFENSCYISMLCKSKKWSPQAEQLFLYNAEEKVYKQC